MLIESWLRFVTGSVNFLLGGAPKRIWNHPITQEVVSSALSSLKTPFTECIVVPVAKIGWKTYSNGVDGKILGAVSGLFCFAASSADENRRSGHKKGAAIEDSIAESTEKSFVRGGARLGQISGHLYGFTTAFCKVRKGKI